MQFLILKFALVCKVVGLDIIPILQVSLMEVCPNNGPGSGPGRWLFYSWGSQFSSVLAPLLPRNGSSRQLTASKGIK